MAGVLRGQVLRCDFGPIYGVELSGYRCAMVLSGDKFNGANGMALVAPTTRTPPKERYQRWYVHIADADNWASLRQIKTVSVHRLGSVECSATDSELDDARLKIAELLYSPGTDVDNGLIPGSVWTANVPGLATGAGRRQALILDYNGGNAMAIVALAENRDQPVTFPYAIPVAAATGRVPGVVRAHQLRSISATERLTCYEGAVRQQDLEAVRDAVIRLIS